VANSVSNKNTRGKHLITLITGVPGSGKSLFTVAELLLPMQTATFEHDGAMFPRALKTNVKNLLLDHEMIAKDNLLNWPEWCKPGDLICFDEVQEVWKPRSMGSSIPDSISKLETHRHMGVDFVLITQHPMLLDQNIRRLVGRHIHVRRVANMPLAILYEWDHASNPAMVKSAITTRPWRYPKSAYRLYKSAEAHTKQPRRLPFALLVIFVAAVGLAVILYFGYYRSQERYAAKPSAVLIPKKETQFVPVTAISHAKPDQTQSSHIADYRKSSADEKPLGCIATKARCSCFDTEGLKVQIQDDQCRQASRELVYIRRDAVVPSAEAPKSVPKNGSSEALAVLDTPLAFPK
jgi:zona occludens toxin